MVRVQVLRYPQTYVFQTDTTIFPFQPALPHLSIIQLIIQARMIGSSLFLMTNLVTKPFADTSSMSFIYIHLHLISNILRPLDQSPCLWSHLPLISFYTID